VFQYLRCQVRDIRTDLRSQIKWLRNNWPALQCRFNTFLPLILGPFVIILLSWLLGTTAIPLMRLIWIVTGLSGADVLISTLILARLSARIPKASSVEAVKLPGYQLMFNEGSPLLIALNLCGAAAIVVLHQKIIGFAPDISIGNSIRSLLLAIYASRLLGAGRLPMNHYVLTAMSRRRKHDLIA
jgi:uncharacterized membrane protein YuzA (DUF378 family)